MPAGIAYKISFTLDNQDTNIMLDTINDVSVDSSSRLTQHPIVNGDTIADHMYKEPISVQISGSFSLNSGTLVNISTSGSTLSNIQKLFERLKNEGIVCTLMKVTTDATQNIRFLQRNNMVLTSISWSEKINSLGFTFGFTQILTNSGAIISQNSVNLSDENSEYYPVEGIGYGTPDGTSISQTGDDPQVPIVEEQDPGYVIPGASLVEASTTRTNVSFTSIDISELMTRIIKKLTSNGYVTEKFMTVVQSYSKETIKQYAKSQVSTITDVEASVLYQVIHAKVYTFGTKATSTKNNAVFDKSFLGLNDVSNTKRFLKYVYETYHTCYEFTTRMNIYYTRKSGAQKFEVNFTRSPLWFTLGYNNVNGTYSLTMYEVQGQTYTVRKTVHNLGASDNKWSLLDTAVSPFYAFAPEFLYIRYSKNFENGIEIVTSYYTLGEVQSKINAKYNEIISNF